MSTAVPGLTRDLLGVGRCGSRPRLGGRGDSDVVPGGVTRQATGMTKILLTGFEPFRQWAVNSSWEAVRHLAERRGGLSAERLPVDHELAAAAVRTLIDDLRPEIVLLTGLADDPVPRLERLGRAGPLPPYGGPSEYLYAIEG